MAPPLRYSGPCPGHTGPKRRCAHCQALEAQKRRARSAGKKPYREAGLPIYREMHWPAPERA